MMKRLAGWTCVALIAMALAGCSWITDFAISNTTGSDLLVSYRARTCPDGNDVVIPARKTNSELRDSEQPWNVLAPAEYSCDSTRGVVETVLPPGMALRVAGKGTYLGPDNYGNEDFDVLRLELKGVEGEVNLQGLKALKAFERKSKVLYVLAY